MNPLIVQGRIKNKKKVEAYIHAVARELGIHRLYSKVLIVRFSTKLSGEHKDSVGETKEPTLRLM